MSGIFDQVINYAPPSLLKGTVTYKGTWSAATNTPTLVNPPDSTTNGFYYVVSAAGTQFSLVFNINDWIISNGSAWQKVDNTDAVDSVFGRTGAVVGVSTDYSSVGITATAVGASSPSTGAFTTLSATTPLAAASGGTGLSSLGTGVATFLGTPTSANLAAAVTDETGSGSLVFATLPTFGGTGVKLSGSTSGTTTVVSGAAAGTSVLTLPVATDTLVGKATTDTLTNKTLTSPTLTTPALGTPASGTLTSCTGLPLTTGVTGILPAANGGTGVANNAAMTVTGSGNFAYTRTLTAATNVTFPTTGTLATLAGSETLTNKTLTSPTLTAPVLGTPASGTVTNLTGTASININGTVGATTPSTVAATTISGTGATINTTTGQSLLTLSDGGVGSYSRLNMRGGGTNFAWSLGAQDITTNALTITPSTAVGGTTFTTPVATFTSTGLNSTVIGATTPAAGSFTTLGTTGGITNTVASGNASTLSLQQTGIIQWNITNEATTGLLKVGVNGGGNILTLTNAVGLAVTGTLGTSDNITITKATSAALILDSTNNTTSDITQIVYKRNGTIKWREGVNIGATSTENYSIYSETAGAIVLVSTTGAAITGTLSCTGALSKGSGSFRIEHPLPSKSATHQLVHSFIEGPKCDLIYRGKVDLVNGKASVNIDANSTMTEGTFEALCRDVQCFTSNESGWGAIRGKVVGNILTIEAQDAASTDNVSWMVIGERKDKHIMDTGWTDDNGRPIVEPLKPVEPALEAK